MVPIRRPSIHHHLLLHGPRHDPWHRLSLLRSRAQKVSTVDDMGMHGFFFRRYSTMVFLGLFSRFLLFWDVGVYWELGAYWVEEHIGGTEPGKPVDSGVVICFLSGMSYFWEMRGDR